MDFERRRFAIDAETVLVANDAIRFVAENIGLMTPDWPPILNRFLQSETFYRRNYDNTALASSLSVLWAKWAIVELCDGAGITLLSDPIPQGAHTPSFRFFHDLDGRLIVVDGRTGDTLTDIDALFFIDDVPLLVEVKLDSSRTRAGVSGTHLRGGLDRALRVEYVGYATAPIREYFNGRCGYLVVLLPEQIRPESTVQQRFRDAGGFLAPFYTNKPQYLLDLCRLTDEYPLLIPS